LIRVPGLGAGLAVVSALVAVTVGGAAVVGDRPQVLGALVGAAIVAGFFLFGGLTIGLVVAVAPRASLLVALLTYTLQVAVLAVVFVALSRSVSAQVDLAWVSWTVVAGSLAWVATIVLTALRTPVEPDPHPAHQEALR
jgi:ATP synthase protein I